MQTLIIEPEDYSPRALDFYRSLGHVWLGNAPEYSRSKVSILVVRLAHRIDSGFLSNFPALVAIASPTTGLTHIDIEVCHRRGVRVFSLADCRQAIEAVTSTSELTIGLIIALLRYIPKAHYDVVANDRWDRDLFRSRQLSRLTLGIVGLGRIGGHLAGYAKGFGMRVLAFDAYHASSRFAQLGVEQSPLESLLEESDVVSIHANLHEDNKNLIGAEEISKMRTGALLVNTARGALVDEDAVVNALRSGRLGGVAVDVLAGEHDEVTWRNSPLVNAAREGLNVLITPHIGGCTSDAMHITEECLADFVLSTLKKVSL